MPPRKPKLTKTDLERFDIRFEGPVPPRRWPEQYRHLFQVIRDIWANRYDNYSQIDDRDPNYVNKYRDCVKTIVDQAAKFRENTGRNESTWRDSIESYVLKLFHKEIRW
jgi:hypothetical protein